MSDFYTKEEADQIHTELRGAITSEIQALQATMNLHLEGLATKEDTREILDLIKRINFGVKFSKISWHVIVGIGGFISAVIAIALLFKFVIAGIITWALAR